MSVVEAQSTLDSLVTKTKTALDMWLSEPRSKVLQQEFREANQALLEFSRTLRETER